MSARDYCLKCGQYGHVSANCKKPYVAALWLALTTWCTTHDREIELAQDYLALFSTAVMAICLAAVARSKDPDFLWPLTVAAVACVACVALFIQIWHRQQEQ